MTHVKMSKSHIQYGNRN